MDDTKADILMMFVLADGGAVSGESALGLAPGDTFMNGFQAADYDDYSNFFEVTNFSFSIKVEPQEQGVGVLSKPAVHGARAAHAAHGAPASGAPAAGASNDPFDRWRSAKDSDLRNISYPVLFDTFSFERIIDAASPVFFAQCANQISFRSATLVKRLSASSTAGGGQLAVLARSVQALRAGRRGGSTETQSVGYLRIDFKDVMLTSLSWNDGDMVTESCEFTCSHMDVQYRQQNMDSSLSGTVSRAEWDRLKNGKPKTGQDQ